MRATRIVWTDDERSLLLLKAQQIRRDDPDVSFIKLFRDVQVVLADDRKRLHSNIEGDGWLLVDAPVAMPPDEKEEAIGEIVEAMDMLVRLIQAHFPKTIPKPTIQPMPSPPVRPDANVALNPSVRRAQPSSLIDAKPVVAGHRQPIPLRPTNARSTRGSSDPA